jgi:hypothetical protein
MWEHPLTIFLECLYPVWHKCGSSCSVACLQAVTDPLRCGVQRTNAKMRISYRHRDSRAKLAVRSCRLLSIKIPNFTVVPRLNTKYIRNASASLLLSGCVHECMNDTFPTYHAQAFARRLFKVMMLFVLPSCQSRVVSNVQRATNKTAYQNRCYLTEQVSCYLVTKGTANQISKNVLAARTPIRTVKVQ